MLNDMIYTTDARTHGWMGWMGGGMPLQTLMDDGVETTKRRLNTHVTPGRSVDQTKHRLGPNFTDRTELGIYAFCSVFLFSIFFFLWKLERR